MKGVTSVAGALLVALELVNLNIGVLAFSPPTTTRPILKPPSKLYSASDEEHWMDFLTYDKNPTFDVLEKTKEYSINTEYSEFEKYYDDDYVFRGSIIGPITADDVRETQKGFNILDAYPDLTIERFGYTIDPSNPYKCFWFERWTGTNTGGIEVGPVNLPATGNVAQVPAHVMSVNWTPEGKIIYSCLSSPLDRFEGNTSGQGAVFGLLGTGGVSLPDPSPGNVLLMLNQRFIAPLISAGKAFSDEKDIPSWWKSKSRGAEKNDM
uniref:Uncharacterized protein n=1 Tax=Ditylum brightwellii TaxID=49249 RepID=A0A7S4QLJ5_9STRA|mmetsp:Transcript_8046/g.10821  ORF Transcript_8046/g.10821 Transcript_8046/m.10821 type:complete len:266 (+) Transcript_8046:153-950(+)